MRRPLCLLCMFYVLTVMLILQLFPLQSHNYIPPGGTYVTYTGEVYAIEEREDKSVLYLKSVSDTVRIICYFQDHSFISQIKIGNQVRISGVCCPFRAAANEGQFDAKQYYGILELDFAMTNCEGTVVNTDYRPDLQSLYQIRKRLETSFERGLPPEDAGVMKAMILGQKGDLDAEVKSLYQRNGIAHILAISGLHITFFGMGIYQLCRKVRLPAFVCCLASFLVIIAFGKMTGSGASTVRSVIMFSLFLLAGICGRTYDLLTALAVSAAALLIYRPQYVYHSGFLLSFGAVMGIALVAPFLRELLPAASPAKKMILYTDRRKRMLRGLRKKCISSLTVGVAVLVATLPVQLYFFFTVSPYSCFLNLLVVPLAGVLMAVGVPGGILTAVFPGAGAVFLLPCRAILSLYEILCRAFDSLPGSQLVIGRPALWKILFYYIVLLGLLLFGKKVGKKKRFLILVSALCLLCCRGRGTTTCTMLDVGQGDGLVIEEKSGGNVLIDGGSSDVSKVGTYRIVPYLKSHGISKIDYIFVSHADADHVSGIKEILSEYQSLKIRVGCLVLTKFAAEDEAYRELMELARQSGTRVLFIGAGDYIVLGETCFTCVYPGPSEVAEGNDQSMVLLMECCGTKTLFTGDLTEEKEQKIKWEDVDILKVGHHGSRYSSGMDFLNQCLPETAIISAGEENSYGHPHADTLERLEESGAHTFVTKESGAITIRYEKEKYTVTTYGK
ncbi:MAG: DNA internalization-related competence protein ComEC/Rec2 [Lachnospiraceae bacterium]